MGVAYFFLASEWVYLGWASISWCSHGHLSEGQDTRNTCVRNACACFRSKTLKSDKRLIRLKF